MSLTPKQQAFAWAYGSTIGNPHHRLVLLTLVLSSTAEGAALGEVICDMPAADLARACEMSTGGVRKVLRELSAAGAIRIVSLGGNLPNRLVTPYDRDLLDLTAGESSR